MASQIVIIMGDIINTISTEENQDVDWRFFKLKFKLKEGEEIHEVG